MDKPQTPQEFQMMSMTGALTFTADGRWLHDGIEIQHQKIRDYYAKHLRWCASEMSYVVLVENRAVRVEVKDTPIVIRTIDATVRPWNLFLSNGSFAPFQPSGLRRNKDDVFYYEFEPCPAELSACFPTGALARLNHPAIQAIAPYLEASPQGMANPEYYFVLEGKKFPIAQLVES